YLHSRQFEKGLVHIDRALAINPQAHFGRERYQKYLAEYVKSRRQPDGSLPLPVGQPRSGLGWFGWKAGDPRENETTCYYFLSNRLGSSPGIPLEELQAAVKGVQGMMKFGHDDSPILLEALGDLLAMDKYEIWSNATQLAARAYLKASYEVRDEEVKS